MNAPGPTEGNLFANENDSTETVGEFTRRIKRLLEDSIRPCWIKGEISNFRQQASGHCYFSLKDSEAQLSCVLFRGDAARQNLQLRDGMQVVAFGEISVYEARGNYQLIVRVLVEDGLGRLQQEFERLKRKLAAEGLFATEKKRPLPMMPATIGFVTSPTGAAVQDFIRILQRRNWRGRLVVLPTKVQGNGAAVDMIGMLDVAKSLGIFDLLVIGRGGGSLEDLWEFNNEALVRAVAASSVPIISAVGHEIDFTLCDFAADVRAETPSAAAELISSLFLDGFKRAHIAYESLHGAVEDFLERGRDRFDQDRNRMRLLSPGAQIERGFLRLDDLTNRLSSALRHSAQIRLQSFTALQVRYWQCSPERRVELESHRLLALWKRLQSVSPASVLNRGFVIVRDEQGRPVHKKAEVKKGQKLINQFSDGDLNVTAE
ncbi:MAG TPA: exodeoxyribonuclease VII large subunit [Opitutaceae bacterium]|nr:exodeoxyribonuclease VII large subunit [Opitutaceae bacterium]